MSNNNESLRTRIRLFGVGLILLFAALGWRLYAVQIERHDELFQKARRQYTSVTTTTPKRGEILDRNGNLLVGNVPCEELIADPSIVGDAIVCAKAAYLLERELGLNREMVYRKLMRKTRQVTRNGVTETLPLQYVMLARNIPLETAEHLKEVFKVNKFKGFTFREAYMRNYVKSRLLSNILGFTRMDQDSVIPVSGVEKLFNDEMSGATGKERYERDLAGRPLYYGEKEELAEGRNGLNVYLTIDEVIQSIMEEELDKLMETVRPESVYAVMVDPKTGDILAMAQRPTFDPNNRKVMDSLGWRLRLIEDAYEPGSIMKPLTISGALDYGVVTPNTQVNCENGRWMFLNRPLTDTHQYGMLTVTQIIQKSSNIGTAKIAVEMGKEMVNRVLRRFGLGEHTGIPLRPETRGIFPSLSRWDGLSISRFPIGYGIAVSPLQMVRAYCALADQGRRRDLRLIARVQDPDTGKITENPVSEPFQLFRNPNTTRQILDMMLAVTEDGGTAKQANIPGYNVAGKTGTARKAVNGVYQRGKYYASFIGIVPVEDPAFVLLLTLDSPSTTSYGGTAAGPTFRAIGERTIKYLDIKPNPELMAEYEAAQKKQR